MKKKYALRVIKMDFLFNLRKNEFFNKEMNFDLKMSFLFFKKMNKEMGLEWD